MDINFLADIKEKEKNENKGSLSPEGFKEIINFQEMDEFDRFRDLIKSCYG